MKSLILATTFILLKLISPAKALDTNGTSKLCKLYVSDRSYSGERQTRSMDVCNAAVDALILSGDFSSYGVEYDAANYLNHVCGMNGKTFKQYNVQANSTFLLNLLNGLEARGYRIDKTDLDGIKSSLVKGEEIDLFMYDGVKNFSCSNLLYVLFRIENYVKKN